MSTSLIDIQRNTFLHTLKEIGGQDWKVLVVDEDSRRLLFNVTKEDDVLNANITNIERLEQRRQPQPDTDAIYLLSPRSHIFQILENDLDRKRYRRAFLVWTTEPPSRMMDVLYRSESRKAQIAYSRSLNIDFYPTESNLVTFREPWSFPLLFHPKCEHLFAESLQKLAQKIASLCISLGEFPIVKFYQTRAQYNTNNACYNIAGYVNDALIQHASNPRHNFPPPSPRPRSVLIITDRAMDLMSPLVHELTYQAMAMDLLDIKDNGDRMTFRRVVREGERDEEEKDVELTEDDKIWVENRHLHMKDLLIKLSSEFKRFMAKNPQFADKTEGNVSVNTIKDMLAGLPEFEQGKEAFSLHIDMATKCSDIFQKGSLLDCTSVEQSIATGLDEDNRKPKNLADQVIKLLDPKGDFPADPDHPSKAPLGAEARMRLLIMYILHRNGVLDGDIQKLLYHADLFTTERSGRKVLDRAAIDSLNLLGVKVTKNLGEQPTQVPPLFKPEPINYAPGEEMSLSRFEPILKRVLEGQCAQNLNQSAFRYIDEGAVEEVAMGGQQASLRSAAQPTWAKGRGTTVKPKQRIIIFMGGGATYAESRACYEISQSKNKEVYLATSHMLTPQMFLQHLRDLQSHPDQLPLPRPPPLPSWINEAPPAPPQGLPNGPNGKGPRPPVAAMQNMNLNAQSNAPRPVAQNTSSVSTSHHSYQSHDDGKQKKDKKEKKHTFGGMFKKH